MSFAIAGAMLAGGLLGSMFSNHQQTSQNSYNTKMWHEQNFYNSPQQQMLRLKQAGLNPYLYANALSGNQAGSPVPSVQGYTGDLGVADAANHMVNYKNRKDELELKKQVLNKTKLDNGILGEQKRQLQLQNNLLEKQIENITSGIDYRKVEQNNRWNAEIQRQRLAQQRYDTRPTGESVSYGHFGISTPYGGVSISPGYSRTERR